MLCLLMPLSNMRSDTAFPTAPVSQEPSVHRGAGVTAPATAWPFGCISPSRSPTTGAATRMSWDRGEPSCWRWELKPTARRPTRVPPTGTPATAVWRGIPAAGAWEPGSLPQAAPSWPGLFSEPAQDLLLRLGQESRCSRHWGLHGQCYQRGQGQPARRSMFQREQKSS